MPDEYASDTRDRPLKSEEEQYEDYLWQESIRKADIYCRKLEEQKKSKEVKEN